MLEISISFIVTFFIMLLIGFIANALLGNNGKKHAVMTVVLAFIFSAITTYLFSIW